jgi:hypothetical protein
MFSFPRLPPHDRGRRRLPCQWSTAWSGAQCHHHSRLCSSEAVTSRTRCCWTPARPSPLSFYPPAAPSSLYHCSRSDPPSPRTQVPHFNGPHHYPVALSPQLSLVVELSHATREWYPHILAQLAAPFPAAPGSIIASFARSATTGTPHIPLPAAHDTATVSTHTLPASPPW